MKEYSGLEHLRSTGANRVYCPKCGNYLEVQPNGWFHGEVLYCPKDKQVFVVQLKDITKTAGKDFLEQCESDYQLDKLRHKINKTNMQKVREVLSK